MTGATNQNSAYYYSYDANNRITGVAVTNLSSIYNIEYQYDIMGNRTMMTTPEGQIIKYTYNQNNQLTKIETDKGNYTFAFDSLNRRIKRTLPNDSYTTYFYDHLSRLTNITHKNAFNITIDTFSYTYDNVGNRITKKDNHKSINYNYDQLYRLTGATPKSNNPLIQLLDDILKLNTESYSYDPVGNRNSGPKATDSYTYDSGNEQLSYNGKMLLLNTNEQNEYDPNGNLIKKTETLQGKPATITNYTYDDENRLIYVKTQQGDKIKEVTFAYDPFGRRISKRGSASPADAGETTNYVYDEQNIIAEYDQNNKQTASCVHGPNIDEPLSAEIRNNRIYYHADGLGSITALTNHMGMTIQKYNYDAFGNIKCSPFPVWIKQPYMYTGREYDTETGLYYYRARYYDPKSGRFVTRDPIGFDGGDMNLYNYVGGNPVNNVDPNGEVSCTYTITGKTLTCNTKNNETISCYALSGDNDLSHQCLKFKGPIPIGQWGIRNPGNSNWAPLYEILSVANSQCKKKRDSLYIHGWGRSEGCIAIHLNNCRDRVMEALKCENGGTLNVSR